MRNNVIQQHYDDSIRLLKIEETFCLSTTECFWVFRQATTLKKNFNFVIKPKIQPTNEGQAPFQYFNLKTRDGVKRHKAKMDARKGEKNLADDNLK